MGEVIPITMVRDLTDLPQFALPEGYSTRKFRRGEGNIWAEVNTAAGTFEDLEAAQYRFDKEFADPVEDMEDRCFFLVHDATNRVVGTAMAWYDPSFVEGENYGRVHWVAIVPEFQGKGLAKPLLSVVLDRLSQSHEKAILGTQTFRRTAVCLYLDLGFKPLFKLSTCSQAWKDLANDLGHPALGEYRSQS